MSLATRLARAEARLAAPRAEITADDRAPFDWYSDGCPCGKPAGECREHPRARANQRPPAGDWRAWLMLMGRGAGKTRSGAEWVRLLAESNPRARIALVGATAADCRDVMIDGESGIMAVCPPWLRPKYEPSKRRLTFPSGAIATTFSAEEPARLRGPQFTHAWTDELAAWAYPQPFDMLMLGLRLGPDPRVCITTTPRPTALIKSLMADPTTALIRGSTHENRANLAPTFFDRIVAQYEGTRLGAQELYAEVLEISEGAWFARFDTTKHVSEKAEYNPRLPVHLAIDAGTSLTTGACWLQFLQTGPHTWRVTCFGDFIAKGAFSEANAKAIKRHGETLPCAGRIDSAVIDPAADQNTSIGPNSYNEYERVFGSRILSRAPRHLVADGLDQLEVLLDRGDLLLHPRSTHSKAAFQNYRRAQRGGEFLNKPADDQSPYEDSMDAIRYGVRSRFPGGFTAPSNLRDIPARTLF